MYVYKITSDEKIGAVFLQSHGPIHVFFARIRCAQCSWYALFLNNRSAMATSVA